MTKVKTESRHNSFFHEDCFGHFYLLNVGLVKEASFVTCTALEKKACRGCKFYKPLSKAYKECLKYGFPKYTD